MNLENKRSPRRDADGGLLCVSRPADDPNLFVHCGNVTCLNLDLAHACESSVRIISM